MRPYFITGIGTDVGKTFILSKIIESLLAENKSVAAIKPIITGIDSDNFSDSDSYKILNSLRRGDINSRGGVLPPALKQISPFLFKNPLSPDQAAALENTQIPYDELLTFSKEFLAANKQKDYSFIEGVGGVFVPINQDKLVIDLLDDLNIKVILIANNYLGCLNHTLATLKALEHHDVVIYFNNHPAHDNYAANLASLKNFTNCPIHTDVAELLLEIKI
ncbi:MAG: dethiobiotin synthase [Rickettsiales bacterium]|jgi:dethiobiotin synthetase|nr:dethiobiotin synthase [Rickettsiales bacterium]